MTEETQEVSEILDKIGKRDGRSNNVTPVRWWRLHCGAAVGRFGDRFAIGMEPLRHGTKGFEMLERLSRLS